MYPSNEPVVILGAGIGGLSTAYQLLKEKIPVVVVDRNPYLGGLMRSVRKGDFCVDLGQKQYYDRIPQVQAFFQEVLGPDLLTYPYRIGVYYRGRIYERERVHRGAFRGLSPGLMALGVGDLVWQRLRYRWKAQDNLEDASYARKGKIFSRIFSQGFDEKLKCRPWSSVPAAIPRSSGSVSAQGGGLFRKVAAILNRGGSGQDQWFHPRYGSGGLVEALRKRIIAMGGEIRLETEVEVISQRAGRITEVGLRSESTSELLPVRHLVSTLRLEILGELLGMEVEPAAHEISFQRGVILVYLFIDSPANFPHTCLYVTSPEKRIGRVTNYGAYACDMVPEGKSCLAFEVFCKVGDQILERSDQELLDLVKHEFDKSGLVDWGQLEDYEIYKLPLGDAATNWSDYVDDPTRQRMYREISKLENLYQVSRTGMDKTIHAGIVAAESISQTNRDWFLERSSPEKPQPWLV